MPIDPALVDIDEISPRDLSSQKSSYVLIDVRNPDEFIGELGHVPDSKLITLGPDFEQFLKDADKTQNYVFICRSGRRSDNAARLAKCHGFERATNMLGGMIAWNHDKLPVSR